MLLLRTDRLPEGATWQYEIKLDGYRAIAFKSGGRVQLRSRNDKEFGGKYPAIVKALAAMPDETVIDGEIVALDPAGRPSFNALQNYGSSATPLFYYVFDVLILAGEDVTSELLVRRRALLQTQVLSKLDEPIRESPILDASLFRQFRGMEINRCPFANLPEARSGRWGQGLTAEKMKDCRWLRPALVGQFEFLEWTPDDHLRHTRFIGLREDKKPSDVTREPST